MAVSIYLAFMLLSIHQFPETQEKLSTNDDEYFNMFVQEVRRYYPFFPFLGARVRRSFIWNDLYFKKGALTLLDLYATNHDASIWEEPNKFMPERFKNRQENPFDFIPQGGGDYWLGHRCAGEGATIKIMKTSLKFMVNEMSYDMPKQDYSYSFVSIPSIPKSKLILTNVRRCQA